VEDRSLTTYNPKNLTGTGAAERTKDRQTCKKLGEGMLGTQMEMHNNLITPVLLLFSSFTLFLCPLAPYFFSIL
jgi:hypothetical protein